MGADIRLEGRVAVVCGVDRLQAARGPGHGPAGRSRSGDRRRFRRRASPRSEHLHHIRRGYSGPARGPAPCWGRTHTRQENDRGRRFRMSAETPADTDAARRKRQGNFALLYKIAHLRDDLRRHSWRPCPCFSRWTHIVVTGNSRYSAAAGARGQPASSQGDNLFLLNKYQCCRRSPTSCPMWRRCRIRPPAAQHPGASRSRSARDRRWPWSRTEACGSLSAQR